MEQRADFETALEKKVRAAHHRKLLAEKQGRSFLLVWDQRSEQMVLYWGDHREAMQSLSEQIPDDPTLGMVRGRTVSEVITAAAARGLRIDGTTVPLQGWQEGEVAW